LIADNGKDRILGNERTLGNKPKIEKKQFFLQLIPKFFDILKKAILYTAILNLNPCKSVV